MKTVLSIISFSFVLFACKKQERIKPEQLNRFLTVYDSVSGKPIPGAEIKLCNQFNYDTYITNEEGKVFLGNKNYSCSKISKEGYKYYESFGTLPDKFLLKRETYMKLKIKNVPPSFSDDKIRIVYFVSEWVTNEFTLNGEDVDVVKYFPIYSNENLIKIFLNNSECEYTPEYYNVAEGDTVEKFIDY